MSTLPRTPTRCGFCLLIALVVVGLVWVPFSFGEEPLPQPLSMLPVPLPSDIGDYVKDMNAAITLGKSLFWDMQAGSDGHSACATCHYQAGVDNRDKNTLHPGAAGSFLNSAPNQLLTTADFPFHRVSDPDDPNAVTVFDSTQVNGSQGVVKRSFDNINVGDHVDSGTLMVDGTFHVNGTNVRQVTGMNTPTAVNAIFSIDAFWDGRARPC
jgi:cytochrome c peroxidase